MTENLLIFFTLIIDLNKIKETQKIETKLIENIGKKESNPLDLMNTALRTIDKYPDDWVHIYTDGSATSGTR